MERSDAKSGECTDEAAARFRDGDTEAFRGIYARHVGRVYAIALRVAADPAPQSDGAATDWTGGPGVATIAE
jgi:hypothetical protein